MTMLTLDDMLSEELVDDALVTLEEGQADPRLTRLSYSGLGVFHSCPRKYQLARLGAEGGSTADFMTELTFGFGHAVGYGVQQLLAGDSLDTVIFQTILNWEQMIYTENNAQHKSLFHAIRALTIFADMQEFGYMQDYEVVELDGKPAIELSWKLEMADGYTIRGAIDLVLINKYTKEIIILELKTSSATHINHLTYKNSEQAVGYNVVMQAIATALGLSNIVNYTVEYLVYYTRMQRYENFSYPKTQVQQVLWIKDRLWDIEVINNLVKAEGSYGMFPTRSSGCVSWGRPCPFMDTCHLDTSHLIQPLRESMLEDSRFMSPDYSITLEELLT